MCVCVCISLKLLMLKKTAKEHMYTNAIKRPIFVGIIKYLVDDLIFNLSQTTLHSTLLTNWLCIYKSNVIEANNSQLSQKADSM